MKLFKTIWRAKREVAIKPQDLLDVGLEGARRSGEFDNEKLDLIEAYAKKLIDEYKPEAQPTEQPQGKKRVLYTAAQAKARAAAARKANK